MTQTILSVDDEPHMLKLLERIITEKTPYKITTTSNSLEVPQLLEKNSYDLVLADLKMPGMDGMDILRLIREKDRFEEVIIITAFGSLESAIETLTLGVFDYITKPFKKEQIIFAIRRAMRWQQLKKDASRMNQMFMIEPYDKAQLAFGREYIRRLTERCEGDKRAVAERSGLTQDRLESLGTDDESANDD